MRIVIVPAVVPLALALLAQDPGDPVRQAREAQAGFERLRRGQLPPGFGAAPHRCDEQIGRFCYWYDPREEPPPAEGYVIAAAREALLVELGAAALRAPDQPWLLGQRIRYLVEAGRPLEGAELAADCAERLAWCAALGGFALHRAGEIAAADSAFSRALGAMPAVERCDWLDLTPILPSREQRGWRALGCQARAEAAERWLELGRPLMAFPGNSVRTEWLARQTIVRIVEGTVTPYGTRFDRDHREMALRYGWPIGWSRQPGRFISDEPSVTGHDPSPAWGFLPVALAPVRWELHAPRPRARFQPPGVTGLFEFAAAQVARLPRGGTTLVAVAWRLPAGHPLNTPGVTAVLAGKVPGAAPEVLTRTEEGRHGALAIAGAAALDIVGVELLHPDGATWARYRAVWPAPLAGGAVLSDLVLFDPATDTPDTIDEVLPLMLPGAAIRRGGQVGVYWEWAGVAADPATAQIRIEIAREGGGSPLLTWSWSPGGAVDAAGSASMALDLARLGRGRYRLDVVLTIGSRELRSGRPLELT